MNIGTANNVITRQIQNSNIPFKYQVNLPWNTPVGLPKAFQRKTNWKHWIKYIKPIWCPQQWGTNEMGDQWDGGPLGFADDGVTNERGDQWDGGPVIWGTNEMGDQWDGGPLGFADDGVTNERGDQWDGGPVIWGTNEMGDQWAPIMYWGTNELGD